MPQAILHPLNHSLGTEKRKRTTTTISLIVGTLLIVRGLYGLFLPTMLGFRLNVIHSLLIVSAGGFLSHYWYRDNARGSYNTCLGYGLVFAVMSITGMLGITELSRPDHTLHGIMAVVLLVGAYDWHHTHLRKMF